MSEKHAFKMPAVEVGMPVQWFPYGDENAHAAFPGTVVRVAHQTVTLAIMTPDSHNLIVKEGVRHVNDPDAKRAELMEQGAWDFGPWMKSLLSVVGDLIPKGE